MMFLVRMLPCFSTRDFEPNASASEIRGAENPSRSRLCDRRLWGSRNRRTLILLWAYYLDAFNSYPLHTWLPSVYRGHDNWYTRGAYFSVLSYSGKVLSMLKHLHRIWIELSHDVLNPVCLETFFGVIYSFSFELIYCILLIFLKLL